MNGRIYDPLAGRFTSPDPIMSAPFQSQGLNRYGYVLNDPVNLTDPSGFAVAQICGLLGECYPNEAPSGAFGDLSSPADIADEAIGSGGLADAAVGLGANAADIAIRAVLGDPFAAKPGHTANGTSSVRRAQAPVKPGAGQGGADMRLAQNKGDPSSGADMPGNVPESRPDVPPRLAPSVPKAPVVPGAAGAAVGSAEHFLEEIPEIEELIGVVAEYVIPFLIELTPLAATGDSVQVSDTSRMQATAKDAAGGEEHTSNSRESTREKHEKGQTRKKLDRGGEKGDDQRTDPRRRPKGHRGPWPKR